MFPPWSPGQMLGTASPAGATPMQPRLGRSSISMSRSQRIRPSRGADELEAERQARGPETRGYDHRRRADQRPPGAEARVTGGLEARRLTPGCEREHGVELGGPPVEGVDQALPLSDRLPIRAGG